ncbi:MAG: hypothetical protein CL766_01800 [Chloroflexi bacterium]|nr:hypothetical protein [Chloroflexota bacterium]MCH2305234.1 hypothetical protein [SAR202 cluster bacterium]
MMKHFNFFLFSSLLGAFVSIFFTISHDILTQDNLFEFWEFVLTLFIPSLSAIIFSKILKLKLIKFIAISNLTFVVPILGASFGASGSEPFITYILLGLVGGAFWSLPFTIYTIVRNQLSKH